MSEWREMRLGEYVEFKNGKSIPSNEISESGKCDVFGSNGKIGFSDKWNQDYPTTVIGRVGAYAGAIHRAKARSWVTDNAIVAHPQRKEDADTDYIFYLLGSLSLGKTAIGSAQPLITQGGLNNLKVRIPPLPIQRQIAAILSAFDDKIELNRQMNRTLEAMARALFQSWFVDFDPVRAKMRGEQPEGMDAETAALFLDELEVVEGREVPRGWRVTTVGDAFTLYGGSTPSTTNPEFWENGEYHWTTPKDMSGLDVPFLTTTERRITQMGVNSIPSKILPQGTVLLSSRAPVGYLAISDMPISINQGYIGLNTEKSLGKYFIINLLQSQMDEIKGMASGTTFIELSKGTFRHLKIIYPSETLSETFEKNVEYFYAHIRSNIYESTQLSRLRDALLPKLLSGELEV